MESHYQQRESRGSLLGDSCWVCGDLAEGHGVMSASPRGAFSLDVPIFTPAGFLGLRNSRESPVLDTFCAHSFSYAEALQLQI